jgi:glycosyltransferase involved in cell wall biosynthesis
MSQNSWHPGCAPVAVVMLSLNEGHNMEAVCRNLSGWAQEVFLVDSYSRDMTVDIALRFGVHVVQRRFRGFGDQWNFALANLPVGARWTMKLDPDERLSDDLKRCLARALESESADALSMNRRLWLMGRPLPITQSVVRVWRTGLCRFSDVAVNEHPIIDGQVRSVPGELDHHDSPNLHHWLEKQNHYTTVEAEMAYRGAALAVAPRLLGTALERRMWLKRGFRHLPFRHQLFFIYHWIWLGAWRAGYVGYVWARLRSDVMRFIEYKRREMELSGGVRPRVVSGVGVPDPRVQQFD